MTAARSTTSTKHVPQYAAKAPAKKTPATRVRAVVVSKGDTAPVTRKARRVTDTGQALFSVDSAGTASRNAVAVTRDGIATFAEFTSGALSSAYQSHWLTDMFETEAQRNRRGKAQLAAIALGVIASVVGRKK